MEYSNSLENASDVIFKTSLMSVRKSLVGRKYKYLVNGTTYDHTYAIVSNREKAIKLAIAMQNLLTKNSWYINKC